MRSTRPPDWPVSRRSKMMQVYFFGRWSRSLILAYTPCVVHLSRVASNPAGEYMSRGGPFPMTSYRVLMSSITAVGMSTAPDLPARTHIVDQSTEGIEAQLRGVAVGPGLGVDPLRRIADGGMRQAHAPVEPRPAAQAPDDRNRNRAYNGGTGDGTRVPEVQNRGAGILQSLCFLHQLLDGKVRAVELGEDRDARANDCFHHAGIAQDLHHVRPSFFCEADGGNDCGARSFLRRAIGNIAADQRALRAAAHGFAADQHLVDGYFPVRRVPPEIETDRVAHRDQVHAGAVRDPRDLGVPGDHADDLASVALHLLESRNRQLVFHPSIPPERHRRAA